MSAIKNRLVGLRPTGKPDQAYALVKCPRCFQPCIQAWDDRSLDERVARQLFDLEAGDAAPGRAVLWYQVDELGRSIGAQMFRIWNAAEGYTGDTWAFHRDKCVGASCGCPRDRHVAVTRQGAGGRR